MAELSEAQKASYNAALTREALSTFPERDDSVAKPSKRQMALSAERDLPRTLMGGTKAMRDAGQRYLPKHMAESDESYNMRLNGATLYNGYEQTTFAQAGKMFARPVVLEEDVPETLEAFSLNVDGQGRALTPFIFNATHEAMVDGVSYVLVDFPNIATGATMADQKAINAQPYWVLIQANDVLGIRTTNVNGKQVLTQFRFKECTYEAKGAYGEEEVERVRVLEPGRWATYRRAAQPVAPGGDLWALESEGVSSLPYVPVVPVYTNRVGYFEGEPPLRPLAELNQEHWVSSSEQRYALTFSRFAMLAVSGGGDTTEVVVGPNKVLNLPQGGSANYVEPSGSALAAGQADLDAIEKRMASAGMQLRVENGGQVTATAAAIDSFESNAGLKAVAEALEDSIEQMLGMTADYLRLPEGGSVSVHKSFADPAPQGTVGELSGLRTMGNLSLPTLWEELKRRHVLDDKFDAETELMRLAIEQGAMMGGETPPPDEAPPSGETPPPEDEGGDDELPE